MSVLKFRIKQIFWSYWIWHSIVILMQDGIIKLPQGCGNYVAAFSLSSLLFISLVPFCWTNSTNRFTTNEGRYIDAVKITIFTRYLIMIAGASLQINSIYCILAFDGSTIILYYLMLTYRKGNYKSSNRIVKALFP